MWTDQLIPIEDLKPFLNHFNDQYNTSYEQSLISVFDNYMEIFTSRIKIKVGQLVYKPKAQGFISFHSFVPDWYVPHHNTFLSVKNSDLWKHNQKKAIQNYYGTQYPFEVEFAIKNPVDIQLQSVELFVDYLTLNGYNSLTQNVNKFFNKAFCLQ